MLPAAAKSTVLRSGVCAPNAPRPWVAPAPLRATTAPLRGTPCRVAQDEPSVSAVEAAPAFPDETPKSSGKTPISELVSGQVYEGTVKTVAAYGAFVDIGATTDGLVHISQLSHSYVKDVNDHISPGQKVSVVLLKIEGENKLSLSMKAAAPESDAQRAERQEREGESAGGQRAPRRGRASAAPQHSLKVGDEVTGNVNKVVPFGAFVKLDDGFEVLLPTSEMSGAADELDPNPHNLVSPNASITGIVVKVDRNKVAISNMTKEERADDGGAAAADKMEAPMMLGGSMMNDISGIENVKLQAMVAALPAQESVAAPVDPEEAVAAAPAAEEESAVEEESAPATEAAAEPEAAPAAEEEASKAAEEEAAAAAAEAAAKAEADAQAAETETAAKAEADAAAKAQADAAAQAAVAEAAAKAEAAAAVAAEAAQPAEEAAPVEVSPKPEA